MVIKHFELYGSCQAVAIKLLLWLGNEVR